MLEVIHYASTDSDEWDRFVRSSKNGTFLFTRAYMDYHAHVFGDHSLIVRDSRSDIVALLPANLSGDTLVTHGGLTYGGLVTGAEMTTPLMLDVFRAVLEYVHGHGIARLIYKTVPSIYHTIPAEEDLYALFRAGATVHRRDVLSVIDYRGDAPVQQRRSRSIKRAVRAGLKVRKTDDYPRFWPIITQNLSEKYGVTPVHSLKEIQLLAGRFPEEIQLFGAYRAGEMEAGVVLYVSQNVCHVQYPGTSEQGRSTGALDLLQQTLIDTFRVRSRCFDFGSSTEINGRHLNEGLISFKEGFGARSVIHDFYTVSVSQAREELSRV